MVMVSSMHNVRFVGSQQIDGEPPPPPPQLPSTEEVSSEDAHNESTLLKPKPSKEISDDADKDLKSKFTEYIRDEIRKRSPHSDGGYRKKVTKAVAAKEKKDLYHFFGVLLDPTSALIFLNTLGFIVFEAGIPHGTPERFFDKLCAISWVISVKLLICGPVTTTSIMRTI